MSHSDCPQVVKKNNIYDCRFNSFNFFLSAVDPSCLWLPATVRQRVGTGDIWLQHVDHSSQFRHPFEPFLPHALSRLPLRGVPPGLTESQMNDNAR